MPYKNIEEGRAYHRSYRRRNKLEVAEAHAKYRENHRVELAAKQKERNRRKKEQ